MAHNLTETDTFTANVSVTDAGDARTAASVEVTFQALTNRTKNLNTRLTAREMYAAYTLAAAAVAAGSLVTLTETHDVGGHTLASDAVQVPAAGTYLVTVTAAIEFTSGSDPVTGGLSICVNGSAVKTALVTRTSAAAADNNTVALQWMVTIATPASEQLSIKVAGATSNLDGGNMIIQRMA